MSAALDPLLLDTDTLYALEQFVATQLDADIVALTATYHHRSAPTDWVTLSFQSLMQLLHDRLVIGEHREVIQDYLQTHQAQWAVLWGYADAQLLPPRRGLSNSLDLLNHCLKLHAREIIYRLCLHLRALFPHTALPWFNP